MLKFFSLNILISDLLQRLLALLGIILLLPLFIIIAFLIFVFDEGPVFFSQDRVGLHGKTFKLYKYKTMKTNESNIQITALNDQRITDLGKMLRKFKLDELTQLFNVLNGDIVFVGYRPEVPKYLDKNNKLFNKVVSYKPGITSPVTLEFRNEEELIENCKYDKEYFYKKVILPYKLHYAAKYNEQRTIIKDFVVIIKTILVSIFPKLSSEIDEIKLQNFNSEYEID